MAHKEELRITLKDFATLLQLIGRVSSLFIGDQFLKRIQEANELVKQLIAIATYSSKNKFYRLQLPEDVAKEFVEV